ncbi:16S rRNA processing protein RimM [Moraxella catarrhalis]|nr:16S rRNA processing protein RimM [Moraxella catarrhalis]
MTKPNLCKTNLVPDASEMIKIANLKKTLWHQRLALGF